MYETDQEMRNHFLCAQQVIVVIMDDLFVINSKGDRERNDKYTEYATEGSRSSNLRLRQTPHSISLGISFYFFP